MDKMDELGLTTDSVLTAIDRGPFVGRTTKMSKLIELYTCVQNGQTWIVSIKGEAGIGKTRLATEFLDWVTTQGADVLQGRAFEDGGRWPYQPLLGMLQQRQERGMREQQLQSTTIEPLNEILSRVLAEMCNYTFNQSSTKSHEKTTYRRLFESFTLLGQVLARQAPLVMFIDDIHWSDFATLDMLQYASRRWIESNTPILVLLTLRTEALVMQPTFAAWLANIERDEHVSAFILNPLTLENTIHFVYALATQKGMSLEGFAHWLYSETQGQPLYIVELLKILFRLQLLIPHLREDDAFGIAFMPTINNNDTLQQRVPPNIRAIVSMQLRQLTPSALSLAAAAAVLGQSFPFAYIRHIAGLNEQEGWIALKELLTQHIFCIEGTYYFFIHDKLREIMYTELTKALRLEMHERALEILRAEGLPISFQAYHARLGEVCEVAFHLYIAAGDRALCLFALRDAITFYQKATHLLEKQSNEISTRASVMLIEHLYLQLGHTYELLHEREHAWTVYRSMLLLAQRMNITTLIGIALSLLAMTTYHEPLDLQTQMHMLALEERQCTIDAALSVESVWQLAQFSFWRGAAEEALLHGKRALQLAREGGLPELIARTLSSLADAQMLADAWEVVEALAEEARIFYEGQQNATLESICLVQIAQAKICRGQPQDGIIATRQAYLSFMQVEYTWGQLYAAYHLITGLLDIGAYEEALILAQEALALARTYNVSLLLCLCLTALGRVQRALMDLNAAHTLHREAMTVFPMHIPPFVIEMLAAELCADCALAGEWAEAQSYATQALAYRKHSTFMYVGLTRWHETEILIRTGYNERATADTEHFGTLIGQSRRYHVPYLRSQAVLALWRGESEQSYLYLQEAALLAEEIGLPGERWSIEATRGELCLVQGRKAEARTAFEHASEILCALAEKMKDSHIRTKFLSMRQVQHIINYAK